MHSVLKNKTSVPPELAGVLDQATFTKARLYGLDKSNFHFICSLWEQIFQAVILVYGGMPFLWNFSGKLISRFGYGREDEIIQTCVFALIGSVITTIIDLPLSMYLTFVIEEKHGFNKQTLGFYFKDKLKKFIIIQAITSPILACIIYIVKIGGDYFFIALWFFCVILSLIIMTVYADYIAPLFDKFTPLPDGLLRKQIEKLADSIDFPLKKLYVVEGSKRSAHSNAYFYDFYKNKQIVLFDTLLEDYVPANKENSEKETEEKSTDGDSNEEKSQRKAGCNNDEILAVLAHELGHWKLNHVLKNLIIVQVNMFLCFAVFALLYKNKTLFQAFGFYDQTPVLVGLVIVFQFVFSPYNENFSVNKQKLLLLVFFLLLVNPVLAAGVNMTSINMVNGTAEKVNIFCNPESEKSQLYIWSEILKNFSYICAFCALSILIFFKIVTQVIKFFTEIKNMLSPKDHPPYTTSKKKGEYISLPQIDEEKSEQIFPEPTTNSSPNLR